MNYISKSFLKLCMYLAGFSFLFINQVSALEISANPMVWHPITITFDGDDILSESGTPNPFTDYRLDVTFTHMITGKEYKVPGYFAADGNAHESSATEGNKWRVHFVPDQAGTWVYKVSFKKGSGVALDSNIAGEEGGQIDGDGSTISVAESDKDPFGKDFRGKGMLRHVGKRYLQFAGSGEYFIKGGTDCPETILGYYGFDNTPNGAFLHRFEPHAGHWQDGDPDWKGGLGKNIIGVMNYLSSVNVNSVYMVTLSLPPNYGDGKNMYPFVDPADFTRYDVSKLAQWEIVFSHMDTKGIMLHMILQENENDKLIDGGALGPDRKLYYREFIARFSHHHALNWNTGEETARYNEIPDYCNYINALDPYDHHITSHNQNLGAFMGYSDEPNWDGPSLYIMQSDATHQWTIDFIEKSLADRTKQWIVAVDEQHQDVPIDAIDPTHDLNRKDHLWGNLMAGGAGVEWYFGFTGPNSDITEEDLSTRANMWAQTDVALSFFHNYLPFTEMMHADNLTSNGWAFAKPGEIYAVYLPNGGSATLDVSAASGTLEVFWYDPKAGGALQTGEIATVQGGSNANIGSPPAGGDDWVALVRLEGLVGAREPSSFVNNTNSGFLRILPGGRLELSVEKPGMVNLHLYDGAGRLVQTLFEGYRQAGRTVFPLRETGEKGLFFLKAEIPENGERRIMKVINH